MGGGIARRGGRAARAQTAAGPLYQRVIQEKDIVRCEDGKVALQYRDAKAGATGQRVLAGEGRAVSSLKCDTVQPVRCLDLP